MGSETRSFGEFFESWVDQHRTYLERLLLAHAEGSETLVQQVLGHYQEYYDEKSRAAESDVLLMFSPPWFSSYERTLLWVAGFKPSMTFGLVKESVGEDLNEEQRERIAVVREETRRAEREIEQAMASVQESVAAPTMCRLVKRVESLVDGEASDMENAIERLKGALREVIRDTDGLRQRTGLRVLEVLSPVQKVRFLAGASQFWLQSRRLGMERDGQLIRHLNE
ncbi:hypothetical protein R6Q59_031725 [Mikania micrantha]|uniref:DOG1 domain-containing protein n=1 Tax=Mikania micrantha TaxID=192012 RepID=A0A5N6NUV7_9ASTR|nr:hypothetical protein E3N88_15169 [Mikania micrantha]